MESKYHLSCTSRWRRKGWGLQGHTVGMVAVSATIWSIWSNSTGFWMILVWGYLLLWSCESSLEWDLAKSSWCLFSRQKCKIHYIHNQHQGRVHLLWEKLMWLQNTNNVWMRWKVWNSLPASQCPILKLFPGCGDQEDHPNTTNLLLITQWPCLDWRRQRMKKTPGKDISIFQVVHLVPMGVPAC